jgi:hypothetical protein
VHGDATFGQQVGMTPRPAADVEHAHPRPKAQMLDQEIDLLWGALGERVPQVGRAEMVRDRLEPVIVHVALITVYAVISAT